MRLIKSKSVFVKKIKPKIPPIIFNNFLLIFPFLYRTKLVNYETDLEENHGIDDLLQQLNMVLNLEGDIIECGSSRCGTSIIIANYLRSKQVYSKMIYACDSFEGFDRYELRQERERESFNCCIRKSVYINII